MSATLKMPKILTCFKHFQIFVLGMYSGMPLAVIYVSLAAWLKDFNIDLAIITSFAISRSFYSLKVLWSPIIDHIKIPVLEKIGHRKSWMILCSTSIAIITFLMSNAIPDIEISYVFTLTIMLGIASSTFDIVFDAFRIEIISGDQQAIASANVISGYRIGVLIAGAGALYVADIYSWNKAFLMLTLLHVICIIFILTTNEPDIKRQKVNGISIEGWDTMIIKPFKDFLSRDYALIILAAIIFYKLGDAYLGVVATPFYLELGFTKSQISGIVKMFGLIATFVGCYLGGYVMYKFGNLKGMIICGIAQSVTNVSFIWLNHMGSDPMALAVAIAIENVVGGMGTTALVGYLSNLCNKQYSATQYALLSSASGFASHILVISGGSLVNCYGLGFIFPYDSIFSIARNFAVVIFR